jgi:trypsin
MKRIIATTIILLTASLDKTMAMTNTTSGIPEIVGGSPSASGAFPYFTLHTTDFFCGGSLIYEDIVVTAAHCKGTVGDELMIGIEDLDNDSVGVARVVTQQIVHPRYFGQGLFGLLLGLLFGASHDIMLLKLDIPVSIQPVAWATSKTTPSSGETLTVMGFGVTSEGGNFVSRVLRQVDVVAIDDSTCTVNRNRDFCAGVPGGGKDSCQGDSGECCI